MKKRLLQEPGGITSATSMAMRPAVPTQQPTSSQKKVYHSANTIDEKHTEMLHYFDKVEHETIPQFKDDIKKWKIKQIQTRQIR